MSRTALDDYTEYIEQFYMCNKCNETIPDVKELKNHLDEKHDVEIGFKK